LKQDYIKRAQLGLDSWILGNMELAAPLFVSIFKLYEEGHKSKHDLNCDNWHGQSSSWLSRSGWRVRNHVKRWWRESESTFAGTHGRCSFVRQTL